MQTKTQTKKLQTKTQTKTQTNKNTNKSCKTESKMQSESNAPSAAAACAAAGNQMRAYFFCIISVKYSKTKRKLCKQKNATKAQTNKKNIQ